MSEAIAFGRWLAAILPTLINLFAKSDGSAAKATRMLKMAYQEFDQREAAEWEAKKKGLKKVTP